MTLDQVPSLLISGVAAMAVITGVIVTVRGVIRQSAEGGGVLKQQVENLEKRMGSMENDVRELAKGQTDMKVALAVIPSQFASLERLITSQHEASVHSSRNLRSSIEALARKAGMLGPSDS